MATLLPQPCSPDLKLITFCTGFLHCGWVWGQGLIIHVIRFRYGFHLYILPREGHPWSSHVFQPSAVESSGRWLKLARSRGSAWMAVWCKNFCVAHGWPLKNAGRPSRKCRLNNVQDSQTKPLTCFSLQSRRCYLLFTLHSNMGATL